MLTAWSVALFAPNVPLRHLLRLDVVVDGVTAIAGRTCGPFRIAWAVVGNQPIRSSLNVIGEPTLLCDVPLRGERVVVVAAL